MMTRLRRPERGRRYTEAGGALKVAGGAQAADVSVRIGMAVLPTVVQFTGRPPRTYAEWVDAHLSAFR
jgi:hypothetical protein